MTTRFSTLHKRGPLAESPAPAEPSVERAVVIPSNRKPAPKPVETAGDTGKASNRVVDARVRLHRMLIEEINLVALERLPKDEMRRQVHEFVSQKTREERLAINVAELDSLVDALLREETLDEDAAYAAAQVPRGITDTGEKTATSLPSGS